jgi:hypothetical protein
MDSGNGIEIGFIHRSFPKRFIYNRYNKLLVRTRSQFRHYTAMLGMKQLYDRRIREKLSIPNDSCRGFIARCFDSKDCHKLTK